MMIIETKKIEELLPADYNPRISLKEENQEEFEKLKKSIQTFGIVDPVIWNKRTGFVVGGHQRLSVLKELGYEEIDVSVVDLDDAQEKALNIALNKISGEWDEPKLKDLLEELQLTDLDETLTGFSKEEIEGLIEDIDINDLFEQVDGEKGSGSGEDYDDDKESDYTDKVEIPTYEPSKDKPFFDALYKTEKMEHLIKNIEESNVTKEEKDFLKAAAYRHVVFDYRNIAEYYAHADKEMQELMEESALVIIDFNKAIENGFVEFTKAVMETLNDPEEENENEVEEDEA